MRIVCTKQDMSDFSTSMGDSDVLAVNALALLEMYYDLDEPEQPAEKHYLVDDIGLILL